MVPLVVDRLSDHGTARNLLLDCYREGWGRGQRGQDSRCDDPSLSFPRSTCWKFFAVVLYEYFDRVQDKLSRSGAIGLQEMAFFLRGLMGARPRAPKKTSAR